jgi:uncharacterized membrane protein
MKLREKVMFSVFGLVIFFLFGGVACTYSTTGGVNIALAAALGVVVFLTSGAVACTIGNGRIAKQKARTEA